MKVSLGTIEITDVERRMIARKMRRGDKATKEDAIEYAHAVIADSLKRDMGDFLTETDTRQDHVERWTEEAEEVFDRRDFDLANNGDILSPIA